MARRANENFRQGSHCSSGSIVDIFLLHHSWIRNDQEVEFIGRIQRRCSLVDIKKDITRDVIGLACASRVLQEYTILIGCWFVAGDIRSWPGHMPST